MTDAVDFIASSIALGFVAWIFARVVDRTAEKNVSIRLILNACLLFVVQPSTLPSLFALIVFVSSQKWL
jgi:hypothetical protein